MRARTVVGSIVGFICWWIAFFLSLMVTALVWPAFADAGKVVRATGDYSVLTTGMLGVLLASYVLIDGIAGWVTVRIARHRSAVWLAVAPVVAYAGYQHLHVLWDELPAWYNLGVVASLYPLTFLGGAWVVDRDDEC